MLGSAFERLAVLPAANGAQSGFSLLIAQQRGWDYTTPECEALTDDAGGFNTLNEPNRSRVWIYDTATAGWSHFAWELARKPVDAAWVGLSEIKTLVRVLPSAWQDGLISAEEKRVHDFQPALEATNGWITDKPEGVAVLDDGRTFVVTDNDGVEDWNGETWFMELGKLEKLFR